jgi:hypothetical protein
MDEVVLRGDKKCPHGYTKRAACAVCDHEDDLAEKDAEIERLRKLLERALPDLQWAESAAQSEWGSHLGDRDIIEDIEKTLSPSAGDSNGPG